MSRPRFLSDHDLNEHIVTGVMRLEPSLEWIRVRDVGLSERSDLEVLAYAAEYGYLVVSHDVNTMPRAAYDRMRSGHMMSGLLMVKQRGPITQPTKKQPETKEKQPVIDLTGTWTEPGGNIVSIDQQGQRLTLRMPFLESMGVLPAFTTLKGTLEPPPNSRALAYLRASNQAMRTELYVVDGGNRLEGFVDNGLVRSPSVLVRQ